MARSGDGGRRIRLASSAATAAPWGGLAMGPVPFPPGPRGPGWPAAAPGSISRASGASPGAASAGPSPAATV
eukprot:7929687-Alexandrium_andersonii.AAC.1